MRWFREVKPDRIVRRFAYFPIWINRDDNHSNGQNLPKLGFYLWLEFFYSHEYFNDGMWFITKRTEIIL